MEYLDWLRSLGYRPGLDTEDPYWKYYTPGEDNYMPGGVNGQMLWNADGTKVSEQQTWDLAAQFGLTTGKTGWDEEMGPAPEKSPYGSVGQLYNPFYFTNDLQNGAGYTPAGYQVGGPQTTNLGGLTPTYDEKYGWVVNDPNIKQRVQQQYRQAVQNNEGGFFEQFMTDLPMYAAFALTGGLAGPALWGAATGAAAGTGAGAATGVGGGIGTAGATLSASELASLGFTAEQMAAYGLSASEIAAASGAVGTGLQAGIGAGGELAAGGSYGSYVPSENYWGVQANQQVTGYFDGISDFASNGYQAPTEGFDFSNTYNQNMGNPFQSSMPEIGTNTGTLGQIGQAPVGEGALQAGNLQTTLGQQTWQQGMSPDLANSLAKMGYSGADLAKAGFTGSGDFGSAFGAGSQGGGWGSTISNFLKTPLIDGTNITGGNVASTGLNFLMQQYRASQLQDAAEKAQQQGNALNQPQRQPFQSAYQNLLLNPGSYYQTPYATGQQALANQAFQANVSKYGPGGTQFSDYLKNFQNIQGQDYFKLADQLQGAGGYNQGAGNQQAYGSLQQAAINAQGSGLAGFGRLLSSPDDGGLGQPQTNPASKAVTLSQ